MPAANLSERFKLMSKWFFILAICLYFFPGAKLLAESDKASEVIFLLVDKKTLTAELKTWPADPLKAETLMKLRIAIGKAHGDKEKEGDNKTPEGIYFTSHIIDGKGLPAKYGPFAIPINFPNEFDLKQGKTGYGIWLHGVEKDARVEEANVTEGCVAFYNADIVSLAKWSKPKQTLVVITDDASTVNDAFDHNAVLRATRKWQGDWQDRDIDAYISNYASDFKYERKKRAAYKRYKSRVFDSYKSMQVDFTNLRVFTHKKYAVAIMNQDFNGDDRYVSAGRKILYWTKEKGQWRISHEVYEDESFETQSYSKKLFAKLSQSSPSTLRLEKDYESKL